MAESYEQRQRRKERTEERSARINKARYENDVNQGRTVAESCEREIAELQQKQSLCTPGSQKEKEILETIQRRYAERAKAIASTKLP